MQWGRTLGQKVLSLRVPTPTSPEPLHIPIPQWCTAQRCATAGRCPVWSFSHGTAPPSAPGHHPAVVGLIRCGWWSYCVASCYWTQLSPCGRTGKEEGRERPCHVKSDTGGGGFPHPSKVNVNQVSHSVNRNLSDSYCEPVTICSVGEPKTCILFWVQNVYFQD